MDVGFVSEIYHCDLQQLLLLCHQIYFERKDKDGIKNIPA